MSLLHLALAVAAAVIVAVFVLLYWHESRRPEIRPRTDPAEWPGPSAAEAEPDRPGP